MNRHGKFVIWVTRRQGAQKEPLSICDEEGKARMAAHELAMARIATVWEYGYTEIEPHVSGLVRASKDNPDKDIRRALSKLTPECLEQFELLWSVPT